MPKPCIDVLIFIFFGVGGGVAACFVENYNDAQPFFLLLLSCGLMRRYCLAPPLKVVPKGDFFCPYCKAKQKVEFEKVR